jgi:hypothetical protein
LPLQKSLLTHCIKNFYGQCQIWNAFVEISVLQCPKNLVAHDFAVNDFATRALPFYSRPANHCSQQAGLQLYLSPCVFAQTDSMMYPKRNG